MYNSIIWCIGWVISRSYLSWMAALLQEFLKSFCENDVFIKDRRKILRNRAGLTDDDKKLAMPSAIDYMLVSAWYVKYVLGLLGYWLANILNLSRSPVLISYFFSTPSYVRYPNFALSSWRAIEKALGSGRLDGGHPLSESYVRFSPNIQIILWNSVWCCFYNWHGFMVMQCMHDSINTVKPRYWHHTLRGAVWFELRAGVGIHGLFR